MARIKRMKLTFIVEVTVECTEPESFKSNKEFEQEDGSAMRPYLKEKIEDAVHDAWQYAARVKKHSIKYQGKIKIGEYV